MAQITKAMSRSADRKGNPQHGDQVAAITPVLNTAAVPPVGGVGTAAGGYDTAANRDLLIAAVTALQADAILKDTAINDLRLAMQAQGYIAGNV